jgi:hypothetical protein
LEKIMSKTDHTSKLDSDRLADGQLDAATGGIVRSTPNGKTDVIKAMGNTKMA